jgi:hypothetical protein
MTTLLSTAHRRGEAMPRRTDAAGESSVQAPGIQLLPAGGLHRAGGDLRSSSTIRSGSFTLRVLRALAGGQRT